MSFAAAVGALDIQVEMSGGIRDDESLAAAMATGCRRVNIGTAALENPEWTSRIIAEFGDRVAVGLDVRGEVFGSGGMLTMGSIARSDKVGYLGDGIQIETRRLDTELLRDAYIAELNHFVDCVRTGSKPLASGEDARAALAIARACIESVQQAGPVRL